MTVTTLGRSTATVVGLLLSDAFQAESLATWILPDPDVRPVLLARLFALAAARALAEGVVDVVDADDGPAGRIAGVALWFDRTVPPAPGPVRDPGSGTEAGADEEPDPQVVEVLGPQAAARWHAAMTAMAARHPTRPHQYLALIGVPRERQGRGIGGHLLRHRLRALDTTLSGAYLEATSTASRGLYLGWGFHDLGRPLDLPDGGPRVWPMWRDPYPHGHPHP